MNPIEAKTMITHVRTPEIALMDRGRLNQYGKMCPDTKKSSSGSLKESRYPRTTVDTMGPKSRRYKDEEAASEATPKSVKTMACFI